MSFVLTQVFSPPSSNADLLATEFLLNPVSLAGGQKWPEIFGNQNPIKVDVGCGHGKFLAEMAQAELETNFVGIDIFVEGLRRASKKIVRMGLNNARLLHADARVILANCFAPEQVHTIYLNFPDPWPKRRHARRRLVQPAFVEACHQKLARAGEVVFATDAEPYLREMVKIFLARQGWQSRFPELIVTQLPHRLPTLYEEKFRRQGLPIYFAILVKAP